MNRTNRRCHSLNELYTRISKSTKHVLYQYMKDHDISLLNYNFNYFFQHCIQKYKIQVISHHFSNHKIEGLTVIDKLGISFSYEKDNPIVKQNFTLCHELGHFILKHDGTYFAESIDNHENLVEREANIFSAVVLMPDIVLLSKIYYSCDTFQHIQNSLDVSKQALFFRLLDLLREYYPGKESIIKQAIDAYTDGQNASLLLLFHSIKEHIITEFNDYQTSLIKKIETKSQMMKLRSCLTRYVNKLRRIWITQEILRLQSFVNSVRLTMPNKIREPQGFFILHLY